MTYEQAYNELQSILKSIESGAVPLAQLPKHVRRAGKLIQFCKDELRGIENALSDKLYDEEE